MAHISKDELRSEISAILKDADLSQLSAKKVRRQLEEKFGVELTERKKEIDELVMAGVDEIQKKQDASEDEDEDEDSESDFSAPEDCGPPKKKAKTSKHSDEQLAQKLQDEEDTGARRTRHGSTPKTKKKADKKKKKPAFIKTSILSDDLAELMGEKEMSKTDVVKRMWQIINERDLKDPANKQFIICDEQLLKIFGEERIRPFGMMKYLKDHMTPGGERPRKVEEGESDDENGAGSGSEEEEQSKKPTKKKSGYQKSLMLSPALANLMGETEMPRSDVVKRMWAIIKERNLADPKNRQFMICDAELLTIFGQKRIRTFGMMKFLKNHMYDKDEVVS